MGKEDEKVLVVPTKTVVSQSWRGIKDAGLAGFEQVIKDSGEFKRRGDVEDDPEFKQVIPYMVFKYNERYFLMQRTDQADSRLVNMYSLGIGGHVRQEDLAGETVLDWARREFDEEVDYKGNFSTKPLGLLNDDSNTVGQVHLGYVILLEGDSGRISVKDEHKSGRLASLDELQDVYQGMETWSQLVVDYLKGK